jgi:hypothetical protein
MKMRHLRLVRRKQENPLAKGDRRSGRRDRRRFTQGPGIYHYNFSPKGRLWEERRDNYGRRAGENDGKNPGDYPSFKRE